MSVRLRQVWRPSGIIAANPLAFGGLFEILDGVNRPDYRLDGALAIVETIGPFEHHDGIFESYDTFKRRVISAGQSEAKGVLVSCDSPGGHIAGMLDTAREIRAAFDELKKPLWWYADAQSSSSAFAQACAADRIFVPETGLVGSVGVYKPIRDVTAADASKGERWLFVASGSHKALGLEHQPITDEAIADVQRIVDGAASAFYGWVHERRGIPIEKLLELAGRELMGSEAVAAGLADEVKTFDEVRALMLASVGTGNAIALTGGGTMDPEKEKAIAALKALAEKGDEGAARALKAMEEEPPKEEKKEEEAKSEGDPKETPAEEKKEEEAKASAKSASAAVASGSAIDSRVADLESSQRASLMASRPDLSEEFKATLTGLPLPQVQKILAAAPLAPKTTSPVAAARAAIGATAAAQTAEPKSSHTLGGADDPRFARVDRALRLKTEDVPLFAMKGNTLVLNPASPKKAAEVAKLIEEGKDPLAWRS